MIRAFVTALAFALASPFAASALVATQAASEPPRLAVSDRVPPFETLALDGSPRSVAFPEGRTTVLLFFLSSCSTCHRMIPVWNDAYPRRGDGVEVLGVIVDDPPPAFFQVTPIAFPVIRSPGRALLEKYKVHKVPVTVRIGPAGVVEDVGHGVVDPIRLGEIFH